MADNIRSAKRISEGLREWARYAGEQAQIARDNETQGGMFGVTPKASRAQVFERLRIGQEANRIKQPAGTRATANRAERQEDDVLSGQAGAAVGEQEAEATYILGFRDADSLGNRAASAAQERGDRLRAKGISADQEVGDHSPAPRFVHE